MSFTLYPHQATFVDDIRRALAKFKKIIACAATGAGKSKIFISISRMAVDKGKTVLIISETSKIFKQISEELENAVDISSDVKTLEVKQGSIYVAMSQTLARRPKIIKQFQALGENLLVITDEAHISTPTKLLKQLDDELHIGFTATPDGKSSKHLAVLYNDCVIGPQPQFLVENDYLSPYYHFERKATNLSTLKKSSTGDYTEQSQEEMFKKSEVYDGVFDDIKKFPYKKCMVFCASIKHCEDVAQQFRTHGYSVAVVHSKNPESSYELFQFQNLNSGVDICISVGTLTKGYDFPAIDMVILLRATLSLSLYLQMCGRGSRISKFTEKKCFRVIDYGGNGSRHLPWNYEHDWSEMWKPKKKKKTDGVAPVKDCPECQALLHASAPSCTCCGFVFPVKVATPKETELVEINTRYNKLRGRKISTLTASELSDYAKSTNKKAFAIRVAKSKKDIGFLKEFSFNMGYKENFAYAQLTPDEVEFHDITIK